MRYRLLLPLPLNKKRAPDQVYMPGRDLKGGKNGSEG